MGIRSDLLADNELCSECSTPLWEYECAVQVEARQDRDEEKEGLPEVAWLVVCPACDALRSILWSIG